MSKPCMSAVPNRGGGYKVLKEGAPQTASWNAGKADVFLFEVPETGSYTFYADNNQGSGADNAGWLIKVDEADNSLLYGGDYDDYGPGVIAYDDQSGGNNNFKIETSLSEGQLVYLRVSDWLNNWDGSCTVHAERNYY